MSCLCNISQLIRKQYIIYNIQYNIYLLYILNIIIYIYYILLHRSVVPWAPLAAVVSTIWMRYIHIMQTLLYSTNALLPPPPPDWHRLPGVQSVVACGCGVCWQRLYLSRVSHLVAGHRACRFHCLQSIQVADGAFRCDGLVGAGQYGSA